MMALKLKRNHGAEQHVQMCIGEIYSEGYKIVNCRMLIRQKEWNHNHLDSF